jgi:plastocyanin
MAHTTGRRRSPAHEASATTLAGRSRRFAGWTAALLLSLWGVGFAADGGGGKPVVHTVTIDATTYRPKTVTVHAGDSIVWVNKDLLKHTATAKNGAFDSGDIPAGGSWKYTVKGDGLVAYGCTYHPTMKGTLRVR